LTKYPAVKILVGALLGFWLCKTLLPEEGVLFPIAILMTGIFFGLTILKLYRTALIIGALAIGVFLFIRSESYEIKTPAKIIAAFPAVIKAEIKEINKSTPKTTRCIIEGEIHSSSTGKYENQRILLTIFNSNKRNIQLSSGTTIYSEARIRPPRPDILPHEFSETQYAKANDIQWIGTASAVNLSILEQAKTYENYISEIRKNISEKIDLLFPEKTKGIAICLLTGDKTQIPYQVKQNFSFAGTAHVLAVSGLHVGIIALIIYLLLGSISNYWVKFIIFSILIISFIVLTGSHASSIRAGFMAIAAMLAYSLQRKYDAINIVALVVLAVLLISPNMLFSVGFQMSVAAITGIIIFYKPIRRSFSNILGKSNNSLSNAVISSLSFTFASSISVAPIIAYYFNVFSIIAPLTNLFCIPLIFLGMIFTIISVLSSILYMPIAELYASSADMAFSLCTDINEFAVNLPLAYTYGAISFTLSVIISLIMIYFFINNDRKKLPFRVVSSAFMIMLSLYIFVPEESNQAKIYPREKLVAAFLPESDSLLVILIDRKPSEYPAVDYSLLNYIERMDKNLTVAINGNCGIALTDKLKKSKRFRIIEIPVEMQRSIAKSLNINEELPQIIEY
jgi:ComEC/Rec2-related protein